MGLTNANFFLSAAFHAMDGFVTDFYVCNTQSHGIFVFVFGCWLELFPVELIIKSYEVL